MTGDEKKVKKDRDPIMMACFIVFLLASCAVIGAFVYDEYVKTDNTLATEGSTVVVNYNGAYYAYYGEGGSVLFDTSYSSVANNVNVVKSNDFVLGTSYSTLSFVVGGTTVITGFGNAVIGYKAGDTVKVCIPVGTNGYYAPDTSVTVKSGEMQTENLVDTMTATQFSTQYGVSLTQGTYYIESSVYGCSASASYNSSTGLIDVRYNLEAGSTYTLVDDSNFGKVTMTVSSISGTSFTYSLTVSNYKVTGENDGAKIGIEMIKVTLGTQSIYITSITDPTSSGTATSFEYKTVAEKYNAVLYFTISIVSVTD